MLILGLDVSTSTTGYAIMNEKQDLLKYGQFSIKDRTLSNVGYAVEITRLVEKIILKAKLDDLVIEDVFCGKNPAAFKTWCYVHGSIGLDWVKRKKIEPCFIMATAARKLEGINPRACKVEIQLLMSKAYNLCSTKTYSEYLLKLNNLTQQKQIKILTKNQFDYRIKKVSMEFEKETGISEHIADSILLCRARFKQLEELQ